MKRSSHESATASRASAAILLSALLMSIMLLPGQRVYAEEWNESAWKEQLLASRAARDAQVKNSASNFKVIDHYQHKELTPLFIHISSGEIFYNGAKSKSSRMVFTPIGGAWEWRPIGEPVSAASRGKALGEGKVAPGAVFNLGRYELRVWRMTSDRLELGVYDNERAVAKSFSGHKYFDPDKEFRVTARYEPLDKPMPVMFMTASSDNMAFIKYGEFHFDLGGKSRVLSAYKLGASVYDTSGRDLLVPFRDRTANDSTPFVGRVLVVKEPQGSAAVLDFNTARNADCDYAPQIHCPIPPYKNWMLDVNVEAGEKMYPLPYEDRLFPSNGANLSLNQIQPRDPSAPVKNVLVFGASGALGAMYVQALVASNMNVTAFVRSTSNRYRLEHLDIDYVVGDLLEAETVAAAISKGKFDVVIDTSTGHGVPEYFLKSMQNIVSASKAGGVKHIIINSSAFPDLEDLPVGVTSKSSQEAMKKKEEDKAIAERVVIDSGITYTVIRNYMLEFNGSPATGRASLTEDLSVLGRISRQDLASIGTMCIGNPRCANKVFNALDFGLPVPQ